jgi:hypothetical protein
MRFLQLVVLAFLAGCGTNYGFGVELTISVDDTVSDAALASVNELVFGAGDDESGTYTQSITPPLARRETLIYRPFPSTRTLTLTVSAVDADGDVVAQGITKEIKLTSGKATAAGVNLSSVTGVHIDLGMDDLGDGSIVSPPDGGTAPSAPSDFELDSQGVKTPSTVEMHWTASMAGSAPLDHYNIYRNGTKYATSSATTYADVNATNVAPGRNAAATIYRYWVSAVDSQGRESAIQKQLTAVVYDNGVRTWPFNYSFFINDNEQDTSGAPTHGTMDVHIASDNTQPFGGYSLSSGNPVCPGDDFEAGGFDSLTIQLKPNDSGQYWSMLTATANTQDTPHLSGYVQPASGFGPSPALGTWGTYTIPLTALGIGSTSFVGSMSGKTLTVTKINSGIGIVAGGLISGPGVAAGTYLSDDQTPDGGGGPATYALSTSNSVPAGTTFTMQRTGLASVSVQDATGNTGFTYWLDALKFTTNP